MIWDSSYWKDDLLRAAQHFIAVTRRRRPSQRLLVDLEKEAFVAAYAIRKLMDAKLISTASEGLPIPVVSYPSLGKPVTVTNWHRLDGLYAFARGTSGSLPLRQLCNQIIHSYVFMAASDSKTGPVKIIWFCSDRCRNRCLYELSLARFADVLEVVGRDYPPRAQHTYDRRMKDYIVRAW